MRMDLNADAGESFGSWKLGNDEELFKYVTSANLACGFHAGDPLTLYKSVRLCKQLGVAVGAHPGFPDLRGFGRREMAATPGEVYTDVLYQLGALSAFLRVEGLPLHHVKAHGALYNLAAKDAATAKAIAQAVHDFDPGLPVVVLPSTPLEAEALALGLRVVREAFPERGYAPDGRLAARGTPGSLIHDPEEAARRAVRIVLAGELEAVDGSLIRLEAQTLCIHGDNPNAPQIARRIRQALEAEGIEIRAF
ncbi:LamB/YcsF family protein [Allomeiothermus silvanus DSM 9946]|uniref:5-oxoprolinase subunit A n=1 Tax=Allomeiothermus silvanus (strain ATCC 700542 / DSM 9946 / NBRC 106475 / NCIMB 13440 / VI-R2) TaxID=526227 RepID=D7BG02_ALLS1|nr:5-oxoprolinase subunit PxpA [Allomeiothermus silvanus]ADH63705.1 LamB/YcsF family protein [Allomeiothermus silvanus DSM 9946]